MSRWLGKYVLRVVFVILLSFGILAIGRVFAATSDTISFQSKLVNSDGTNVANGTYNYRFLIYSASSSGTALWSEDQAVAVTSGIVSVQLGSQTAFPATLFDNADLYLQVCLDGNSSAADSTDANCGAGTHRYEEVFTTRKPVTAVPIALRAKALTDSLGNSYTFNSFFRQGGNAFGAAGVLGTTDNNILHFVTNNVTAMTISTTGNVGIGTQTPDSRMHISALASQVGLIVQGSTGQSANLTEWRNSSGYTVASIASDGSLRVLGSGAPPETSYTNLGGSGARNVIMSVTTTLTGIGQGSIGMMVNGSYGNEFFFSGGEAVAGKEIKFDFLGPVVIDEAIYYQDRVASQGVWKWQGSNNATDWTDIGGTFNMGSVAVQTITTLAGNVQAFRYYRVLGISGVTNWNPWVREFDFKIGTPSSGEPVIVKSGYIGIGTLTPTYNFHLEGAGTSAFFGGNVGVGAVDGAYAVNVVGNGKFSTNLVVGTTLDLGTGAPSSSLARISGVSGTNSYITSGSLGLGTTAPLGKLDIYTGTADAVALSFARVTSSTTKASWFSVNASDETVFTTTNASLDFRTNYNGGAQLSTMYLNASGQVGIGTAPTGNHMLDVNKNPGSTLTVFAAFGDVNGTNGLFYLQGSNTVAGINSRNNQDLAFYAANTERLRIQYATGNIGIGTSSPSALLTVGNITDKQGYIRLESGASANRETNIYTESTGGLRIDTNGNAYQVRIDGSQQILGMTGNVGVGTLTPTALLDVGTAGLGSTAGGIKLNSDSSNVGARLLRFFRSGVSRFDFGYDGSLDTFFLSNGSYITWAGDRQGHFSLLGDAASHAAPVTDVTFQVQSGSASVSPLRVIGTVGTVADFSSTGNVGIGITGAGQKLSVAGTLGIRETGTSPTYYTIFQGGDQSANITYTLPSITGSLGQILATNGSGVLEWSTPPTTAGTLQYTRSDVTASRVIGNVYQNTTSKTKMVVVQAVRNSTATSWINVDSTSTPTTKMAWESAGSGYAFTMTVMVPPNYYYQIGTDASVTNFSVHEYEIDGGIAASPWTLNGGDIYYNTGNVGIGTVTPGQKLTVEGTLGILEGGTSPTYHTIFQGGDQSANITYTLPTASTNGVLRNTGGVLTWDSTVTANYFTDSGAITYLTSTTDNFAIGGTNASSKFYFDATSGRLTMNQPGPTAGLYFPSSVGIYVTMQGLLQTNSSLETLGKVYTFGGASLLNTTSLSGYNELLAINKVSSLDTLGAWDVGVEGDTPRFGVDAHVYKGKIYYAMGADGGSYYNNVAIYDIERTTWLANSAAGGTARSDYASALYNGKIYIWGGTAGSGVLNTMDIYDIESNTWSTGLAGGTARSGHVAAEFRGKIYFLAGVSAPNVAVTAVDIYDITTNTWSTGAAGGNTRSSARSVLYNNNIYIWGGTSTIYPHDAMDVFDRYDILSNTWSVTFGTSGTGRSGHISVLYNGKIYSLSGTSIGALKSVDIYDIATGVGSEGVTGGEDFHTEGAGVLYNGKVYIWGGLDSATSTMDVYDIGDRQSLATLYDKGAGMLSFRSEAVIGLDYGKLSIMGGNVGVGVTNPTYKLQVNGNAANTTGVWTNYSDSRLKNNVAPITNALGLITQLQGVTFNWNDPEKNAQYGNVRGFIAQDVEKVIPDWVITDANGMKAIQPIGMEALLVEAIKEQQAQINQLMLAGGSASTGLSGWSLNNETLSTTYNVTTPGITATTADINVLRARTFNLNDLFMIDDQGNAVAQSLVTSLLKSNGSGVGIELISGESFTVSVAGIKSFSSNESGTVATKLNLSDKQAGKIIILAGQTEIIIPNLYAKTTSVAVASVNGTKAIPIAVRTTDGTIIIKLAVAEAQDIEVNWVLFDTAASE